MSSQQTKLARLAPGILQLVILQLHYSDLIPFAQTCGRFSRLILDKWLMSHLMYNSLSLYYKYYDYTYDKETIIFKCLPNDKQHGTATSYIDKYYLYEVSTHANNNGTHHYIIWEKILCAGVRHLDGIWYSIDEMRVTVMYSYSNNRFRIILKRYGDDCYCVIHGGDPYPMGKYYIVDDEFIKEIYNNRYDMCREYTHLQKYIDYLRDL